MNLDQLIGRLKADSSFMECVTEWRTLPASEGQYAPLPDDMDAPPDPMEPPAPPQEVQNEAPAGFWTEIASQVRKELRPPASGFFATTENAPIKGVLQGERLLLVCSNQFTMEYINKPEILDLVSRKASAKLGRPVRAVAADRNAGKVKSAQMEQLLNFGRAHSDIVKIKDS